jgi:D-beta-D-heptose 7-phosphate kinase/D-beta-D-heptose 1-phosphate adenosyltransferase
MEISGKIKTKEELAELQLALIKQGKVVVFTNGCFDVIHRGHVEYLDRASRLGDVLIVGLNSDESTRRLKGKGRPLVPQEDRAYVLASLAMVDYVSIFDDDTPLELIKFVKPNVLVKGGDYKLDEIIGREFVERHGGKVLTIPLVPGKSTTEIINKLTHLLEKEKFGSLEKSK